MHRPVVDTALPLCTGRAAWLPLLTVSFVLPLLSCNRSPAPPQSSQTAPSNTASAVSTAPSTQPVGQDRVDDSLPDVAASRRLLAEFYRQGLPVSPEDKRHLGRFVETYWPYCRTMDYVEQSLVCQVVLLKEEEERVMSALINGRLPQDLAELYKRTVNLNSLDDLADDLRRPRLERFPNQPELDRFDSSQALKPEKREWMGAEFQRRIAFDEVRNDDMLRVRCMISALRQRDAILKEKLDALATMLPQLRAAGINVKTPPEPYDPDSRRRGGMTALDEFRERSRRTEQMYDLPKPCARLLDIPRPPGTPWQSPKELAEVETHFKQIMDRLVAEEQPLLKAAEE